MQPPIIIDEHGDLSLFATVEAAARKIEPIDVRHDEYVAYDSEGFVLKLVPTEPVVTIAGRGSATARKAELAGSLRSFLERTGAAGLPARASLEELLSICIARHGYTA